ncbi:hypothetical protein B0J17DRAFT_642776 [Rhizoctonia solani]|nr:hypothetical protein B0J17DRAFT_642776 [Rhizoctonia solani]
MSLFPNEPITELEPQTKAKLRSTQILTSLPQLISELVQNSLDAGASHIEVGVDPAEWECWVRDDGQGMSIEGMRMLAQGHEKGRYNSSKAYEASYTEGSSFGFRGEALASAMELSCLELSSRTPNARESWSVILKGGEQLYLGPSVRWRREKTGTTVVCRDVFFNVPVRRRSHPNSSRTLELVKKELEIVALVFPQVSFTLDHTNELQKTRVLSVSKTSSSLGAFRALYGKAMAENVEELNVRSEDLVIEGFISLNGSHSRGFQNFYVNRHPMVFGEIQRAIEQKFAASGFGRLAQGRDGYDSHLPPRAHRSPKKVERKPAYVLNLNISPAQVDNFLEPAKSMIRFQDSNRVLSFVLEVIHRFLSRNGFSTTALGNTGVEAIQAETPSGSSRKRVRREILESDLSDGLVAFMPPGSTRESIRSGSKFLEPHSDLQTGGDDTSIQHDDSRYFDWVDPSTGESPIDSQTGNSLPKHRSLDQIRMDRPAGDNGSSEFPSTSHVDRRWLKKDSSNALDVSGTNAVVPTWLVDALKRNNTFAIPETSVFSTQATSPSNLLGHNGLKPRAHTGASLENKRASSAAQFSKSTSRDFSRTDLQHSEVIAQVDTKFIACVFQIAATSERTLILVDQHAADERVRVERYLKRLCTGFITGAVETFQLDSPTKILLARREAEVLARPDILNALSRWGLCIKIDAFGTQTGRGSIGEPDFCQAEVISVPNVISKRLVDKRELSEFVKAMVTIVDAEGCSHWPPPSASTLEDSDWVKALRFCPTPLFELVNSRACRGAIMFNDPLDQRQCQHLIVQLGGTIFPFQCAHGRPSIAPLLRLDSVSPTIPVIDWRAFDFDQEL